jgi:eukaryotic-like serine/threonine-protein kinase
MDAERWRRVEELYYEVVAHPPEHRAELLEASCSGDPELRQEVETLLGARDEASEGDFLSPADLPRHVILADPLSGVEPVRPSFVPAVGSRLGNYEILGVLGAGAMGEVYRARDTRLGREVALKILPPHLTHDSSRVARFQAEARAASALNHLNCLTIYETGNAAGTWFIAAELIEGVTLREHMIRARGPLPVDEALHIARQCASTLALAHHAGIVHRDIKPENIMIRNGDHVVKVVDFGLARILEPSQDWAMEATQTGSVMGTPRYMSPEQARGQKPDARSDIFSLGAVLYEMIVGRPAFPGTTAPEIFASLLGTEPDLQAAGPLAGLLSRAMVKDPGARLSSMEEFADYLSSLDRAGQVPTERVQPVRSRPFRVAWIAATGVAIAVVAATYAWITREPVSITPAPAHKVVPLFTSSGPKGYPAISPDGKFIAFSWLAPGNKTRQIYVQTVGTDGDPKPLSPSSSSNIDDGQAAWSPDGKWIAFTRLANGDKADVSQEVHIAPADGSGPERKLAAETWRGLTWSADGKELALTNVPANDGRAGGVYRVSVETGQQSKPLTSGFRDSFPVFSPDGKWIAFKRQITGSAAQIFVIPADGNAPARQLSFDPLQPIRASTWTPDSREIVLASLRSGSDGSLWRVPVTGGPARPVSATLRDAADPTISRHGRLGHLQEWIDTNLYLYTVTAAASSEQPRPVVSSSREDHSPAFSPDAERIAFVSERSGNLEIWTSRRDGTQPVQLTSLRAQTTGSPGWSPDGKRIAFDSWATGKSNVYVVDAHGGMPRPLTKGGPLGSWMPSWSPDGQWIYFSRGISGASEIWKVAANGGAGDEPVQLTRNGAFEARPSPDGSIVYYSKQTAKEGREIWSVSALGGGEEKPVPELAAYRRIGRSWGVTEQGIYFVSYEEGAAHQTVRLFSFRTRKVTSLFPLQKQVQWGIRALALSRDGRYGLGAQLDHSVSDLMMIENFR